MKTDIEKNSQAKGLVSDAVVVMGESPEKTGEDTPK